MNSYEENNLALAARHVAEGRVIVARQRDRIVRLKVLGCSTLDHKQTLTLLEGTLKIMIDHEQTLRKRYARENLAR